LVQLPRLHANVEGETTVTRKQKKVTYMYSVIPDQVNFEKSDQLIYIRTVKIAMVYLSVSQNVTLRVY